MKKALVSGGAGFIGSHLCTRLINEGNRVICLDNFFTGSKDNIKHLIGHPCFELVEHDVVNPYCADVDEIYNLACPASPIHYQYDAIKTAKTAVFLYMPVFAVFLRKCKPVIFSLYSFFLVAVVPAPFVKLPV